MNHSGAFKARFACEDVDGGPLMVVDQAPVDGDWRIGDGTFSVGLRHAVTIKNVSNRHIAAVWILDAQWGIPLSRVLFTTPVPPGDLMRLQPLHRATDLL